jgi:repressor of nif and glnA expression
MASMVRFQENMKKLRENPDTSRAGLKWDEEEDNKVITKIKKGIDINEIAKELKRTVNSIKTRIVMQGIKEIEENKRTKNDVFKELKITDTDIKEYKEKKVQRDEQQKQYSNIILNKNITNPTIKDNYCLLKEIAQILIRIEEKLDK